MCREIAARFAVNGRVAYCERYGCGHINETYLVETDGGARYILQKINDTVFRNVPALMENVSAVTRYLRARTDDPRRAMHLVQTTEGADYLRDEAGGWWRMYDFIENSICLQAAETDEDFYQSAVAFGEFQRELSEFPAHTLHETIAKFHDTRNRYVQFREALNADPLGRAASVQTEIEFALAREKNAGELMRLLEAGELPLRVTHNDTKLNNVLLDRETRKPLCVIDLDTVMPGLAAFDFGDSIRFGASTAAEDETDLGKVEMSLELFETYARGFLEACGSALSPLEKATLPLGAKLMTLECGVRFLTDYLSGDTYFRIHRPNHNIDRCRTQFKLVSDMEKKQNEMRAVIEKLSK
ncbi:MAG: aminoglycoside phosphotransferase family protein [Clostridia bacterium]|nr:aminoglycoside phosphotransferase family protein [Clostridia bacterium]